MQPLPDHLAIVDSAALDRLDAASGGGLSAAMAALFERRIREQLPVLQLAVRKAQWSQAALLAHGFAAAAGQLGLEQCLAVARELETACDNGGGGAAAIVDQLDKRLHAAHAALSAAVSQRASIRATPENPT